MYNLLNLKYYVPARDAGVRDALPPILNPHHHPEAEGVGSAGSVPPYNVLLPPPCIGGARRVPQSALEIAMMASTVEPFSRDAQR